MLGNEELQERLAHALESQVHWTRFDRFSEPEWLVMLALFSLCHSAYFDLYVHDVTEEVNRMLRETGETACYSHKKVGNILNMSLGFPTQRRGEGYRFALTRAIRQKIHRQAKAMGLKRSDVLHPIDVQSGFADQPCDLCSEFDLMTDHEGRKLRPITELEEDKGLQRCTNCGAAVHSYDSQCPRCDTPK